MSKRLSLLPQATAIASIVAGLATTVSAQQSLVETSAVIVAVTGATVPDTTGTPIPGLTFTNSIDDPVIDEQGYVAFRAQITDNPPTLSPINNTVIVYGSSPANLKLVVRAGDQAPGMAPGVLLRTSSGISSALSATVRLTPDGRTVWGSKVFDNLVTITDSNDDCLLGGPFGSQALLVRDGDIAPGTGAAPGQEAAFAQAFSSPAFDSQGMNRNGVMWLLATLRDVPGITMPPITTGPGVTNNQGIWVGLPGNLEVVVRKNDPVNGLAGEKAINATSTLTQVTQINDSNKLLFEVVLSTSTSAPVVAASNDRVLMVHTLGAGNQLLVREGDAAPGTAGATFNAISADAWQPRVGSNNWLPTNETIFQTELRGGDTTTANNQAVYRGGIGTLGLVARKGDPAPGTPSNWLSFAFSGLNPCQHNVAGKVAFQGALALTGGVTTANDTGIWAGLPNALQLVVREGDVLPGTGGSTAPNINGVSMMMNDANQILFQMNIVGGAAPGNSMWLWDAVTGLRPVVLQGDQVEVAPSVFKTVNNFSVIGSGNTDGAALMFGHDGEIAMRVNFTDFTRAVLRIVPDTIPVPYCFGDGTGTFCPCSPAPVAHGDAGKGCPNNLFPGGAQLTGSGIASISADSLLMTAYGMPNGGGCLIYQGTTNNGGLGTVFGDGLRCAAGTVARMKTHSVVLNTAQYPDPGFGDNSISQRGGVVLPGNRYYQGWYRSANPSFCTVDLYNLTNGVKITWEL